MKYAASALADSQFLAAYWPWIVAGAFCLLGLVSWWLLSAVLKGYREKQRFAPSRNRNADKRSSAATIAPRKYWLV